MPSAFALFVRRVLLLTTLFLFCRAHIYALDPTKELGQYAHDVWQTEEGLPQNTVRAITQTRDGYLWLTTEEGLARYDGARFAIFDKQNTTQIVNNYTGQLLAASDGGLWIGAQERVLRWRDGKFTAYTSADGLPAGQEWSFYEDQQQRIWAWSADNLARYADGRFSAIAKPDGATIQGITALASDTQGALWVGTRGEGLYRVVGDRLERLSTGDGLASDDIKALYYENAQQRLWIGTRNGLNFWQNGALRPDAIQKNFFGENIDTLYGCRDGAILIGTPGGLSRWSDGKLSAYTTADGLPSMRISTLYEDRDGGIWIGTAGGLARLLPAQNRLEAYTARRGLSNNSVLAIYEDREGSVWVGTESGGLNVFKDVKFTTYTARDGLSADLVRAVYEDARGNLWIGAHEGGLNLLRKDVSKSKGAGEDDGNAFTHYTTRDGLSSDVILSIYGTRDGALWVGTPDGLNQLKDGRFTVYTFANGLANDFVRSLYEDREGRLWIGTRGGLSVLEGGEFKSYTTFDGLPNDYIGVIYEDRGGALWVGTLGGLSRFKDGRFTTYTTKDGLSSDIVTSLYEDETGCLWIGTNGGGLVRLRNGKFNAYTTAGGLYNDVIYRIMEDAGGNLWMSSTKGIFRLSRNELNDFAAGAIKTLAPVVYGTADGMKTSECSGGGQPAGWKTADGKLWFATIKGVAMIDPQRVKVNSVPPLVAIEGITADERDYDPYEKGIELPPRTSRFDFHYAGLSYIAPSKVMYKYKLENFDRDWVDAGNRRTAFYTNIPPGDYTFRVMARNNDGVWSDAGASYSFRLKPSFYQTYLFYALCLALAAALAWGLYRLRVKRIEMQFSAVLAERNRIAREIHDTLAQGFAGISVQLELVARMLTVSGEKAQIHLDQARILVRNSLAEARRSVWDLRSQSLEAGGLPVALSETARQISAGSNVQTQVQVSGSYRALTPNVENNLLRIGQEAMTNAVKHARAAHIRVELKYDAKSVRLSVRDDGRGFDPKQARASAISGHFGLVGMRERAAEIGGKLFVNSAPNAGTEVAVEIKLND